MTSRILAVAAACISLACGSLPAPAQIQPGGMTAGSRCPTCGGVAPVHETAAQRRQKATICAKAASDKGLKGKDRVDFLKLCNGTPYSEPFTPPDWPRK